MFAAARANHWIILLFMLALLVPAKYSFEVSGLRLTMLRSLLLVTFIPTCVGVFSGRSGGVRACDALIAVYAIWVVLALLVHHGTSQAIETGGIYLIESLGAYLIARSYIRDAKSFLAFVSLLVVIVAGFSIFTVPESITGRNLIQGFSHSSMERRLGLSRAYGSLEHPILYGVFCSSAVAFAWLGLSVMDTNRTNRLTRTALVTISTAMSVSSGALAGMLVQYILIGWNWITRNASRRWLALTGLLGAFYVLIDLLSNRGPIRVALHYLTMSPATAYNRITVWNWGIEDVKRNPIFGIGLNPWTKPAWMHSDSMDNFWLVVMVRYGLPAFVCLALAILSIMFGAGRQKMPNRDLADLRKAWIVAMIGLAISASTVHLWNAILVYFHFLIGAAVWILDPKALQSGPTSGYRTAKREALGQARAVRGAPVSRPATTEPPEQPDPPTRGASLGAGLSSSRRKP